VAKREPRETQLKRVMVAFGFGPTDVARVARRIARDLGIPSISRNQVTRLSSGRAIATEERIYIITAAVQELSAAAVRAADLFNVEPPLKPAPALAHVPGAIGSNLSASQLPLGNGTLRTRRTMVPEETGISNEAFETLYREYGALLRVIAIRQYRIPTHDAEALVHDTFLAYLQRHTYVHDVKAWLYGTVRHRCIDYWRERDRECPLLAEHDETVDQTAHSTWEQWFRRFAVSAAIAQLGEKCRETLRGYYFRDEKRSVLADRLSTTPGNIDQLISICKRRLVELFHELTLRGK